MPRNSWSDLERQPQLRCDGLNPPCGFPIVAHERFAHPQVQAEITGILHQFEHPEAFLPIDAAAANRQMVRIRGVHYQKCGYWRSGCSGIACRSATALTESRIIQ